jgi:uncharacterized protein
MFAVKRLTCALLILLAFDGCKGAPETTAARAAPETTGAESAAAAAQRPILYVVRGKGEPSFLFGTIHAGISAKRVLGEKGLGLVARSRVLLTELPADIDPTVLLGAMLLPEETSLNAILGEARFRALSARITSAPPALVDRLAPWAAMLQAGVDDMKRFAKSRGGDATAAMDAELQSLAQKHGIPNLGLEAVEDQIAIFTSIEPDVLIELIDDAVSEKGQATVAKLYEAYLAGDADTVLAITEEDKEDAPELFARLLPERNRAWMKALMTEIETGNAFVAVGAAHLLGEDGLVDLLRSAGFTVDRAGPADY